jgi:hypothetical protein
MSSTPTEVRQCAKCQQPTVVLVMEWEHSTFGAATHESTKDYRCQSCGAWFVRRARSRVIAFWIVGVLFSIPCLLGAPFLYLAWLQSTFDKRLPIVTGAPEPRMRFPGGAPKRTCGKCGGIAKTVAITRHTHNGLPTGTDYDYVCGQCGLAFSTENFLGHAFSSFGGLALGGIAAGFFFGADSAGWKWGGSIVAALLTVFLLGQNAVRIANRFKHKVIEDLL